MASGFRARQHTCSTREAINQGLGCLVGEVFGSIGSALRHRRLNCHSMRADNAGDPHVSEQSGGL